MKKTLSIISILAAAGIQAALVPGQAYADVQVGPGREVVSTASYPEAASCRVRTAGEPAHIPGQSLCVSAVSQDTEQDMRLQELERAVIALQQQNAALRAAPSAAGTDTAALQRTTALEVRIGALERSVALLQTVVVQGLTQLLALVRAL